MPFSASALEDPGTAGDRERLPVRKLRGRNKKELGGQLAILEVRRHNAVELALPYGRERADPTVVTDNLTLPPHDLLEKELISEAGTFIA